METNFNEMTLAESKAYIQSANKEQLRAILAWESEQYQAEEAARKAKKFAQKRAVKTVTPAQKKAQKRAKEEQQANEFWSRLHANPSSLEAIKFCLSDLTNDEPANLQLNQRKVNCFIMVEEVKGLADDFGQQIISSVLKFKKCSDKQLYCIARSLVNKVKVTFNEMGGVEWLVAN